jgi:hypothetical protein
MPIVKAALETEKSRQFHEECEEVRQKLIFYFKKREDFSPEEIDDETLWFEKECEILRRKLIFYFRARNVYPPEDYANETLARLIKNIKSDAEVENFDKYFYAIARNVRREAWREPETVPLPDGTNQPGADGQSDGQQLSQLPRQLILKPPVPDKDVRKFCLRQSFRDIAEDKRLLLLEFSEIDHGNDQDLTELCKRFGIPVNLNKENNTDKFQTLYTRLSRTRSTLRQLCLDCIVRELGNGAEITGERRKQMIEFLKTGKNKK